jgi:hypothetical protein
MNAGGDTGHPPVGVKARDRFATDGARPGAMTVQTLETTTRAKSLPRTACSRLASQAGYTARVPPAPHRDVNPIDEPQRWIIGFVGTGKLVENVDGPTSA